MTESIRPVLRDRLFYCVFIDETEESISMMTEMISRYGITGKRIHDVNIAAVSINAGIEHLIISIPMILQESGISGLFGPWELFGDRLFLISLQLYLPEGFSEQ